MQDDKYEMREELKEKEWICEIEPAGHEEILLYASSFQDPFYTLLRVQCAMIYVFPG